MTMNTAKLFDLIASKTSKKTLNYVDLSFDIATRISELLNKKKITQKQFSNIIGKSESQISKWLRGNHNFTIETIAEISAALNEEIIFVPTKKNMAKKSGISKKLSSYNYKISPYLKVAVVTEQKNNIKYLTHSEEKITYGEAINIDSYQYS